MKDGKSVGEATTLSELKARENKERAQEAARDRCADYVAYLILKYGPAILEQWEREEKNSRIKSPVSLQAEETVL